MKYLVVLLCLVVVSVCGFPARKSIKDDFEDSFFIFPMGRHHRKTVPSVVELDVGDSDEDNSFFPSYFRPFYINPFSFMNFGFPDFFSKPFWFDNFFPKTIPDDAMKNATSTTKVIDGHKITVNETSYENERNGEFYRVQVINIAPLDSKEEGDRTTDFDLDPTDDPFTFRTPSTEGSKPDHNSHDNEIHREEMFERYELSGDDPSVYDKNVEVIEVDNNHLTKRDKVDLSGDIRINALRAENARRGGLYVIPPDVEVFDTLDYEALSANYQQQQPIDAQEIIRPNFKQEGARPQSRVFPYQENQKVVPPQYNQQVVPAQYNQQGVPAQYNQQGTPAQYNQQAVPANYNRQSTPAKYNQQAVPANYNQQGTPAQYNQQAVPANYNQQDTPAQYNQQAVPANYNRQGTPAQYNQQAVPANYNQQDTPAQYNQQAVPANYNQQGTPAQYNQQAVPANYNQQAVPANYNQQGVSAQYNQQVLRPQYNQQQM